MKWRSWRSPAAVISHLGTEYRNEDRRWLRQNLLIRGMIRLFVTDVIENAAVMLRQLTERHGFSDRQSFLASKAPISRAAVWFSDDVHQLFFELKTFIYRFINQPSPGQPPGLEGSQGHDGPLSCLLAESTNPAVVRVVASTG